MHGNQYLKWQLENELITPKDEGDRSVVSLPPKAPRTWSDGVYSFCLTMSILSRKLARGKKKEKLVTLKADKLSDALVTDSSQVNLGAF